MTTKTFMMMAGGTGGHIFPALAVAKALQKQGHKIIWLGAEGKMETRLVPQVNPDIVLEVIPMQGMRGNGLKRKLAMPLMVLNAIRLSRAIMKKHRVDAVIGFGGFVSFPGGVAAKSLGKPVLVHEQNAIAGLSNKLLAKFANRVLFAFPGVFPNADGLVGNPVREEIAAMAEPEARFAGRSGKLKLLVVGGSLGAKVFNDTLPEALAQLPEAHRPIVRHQTGKGKAESVQAHYQTLGIDAHSSEFIDDMVGAYAEADLVLCRAGALTVAELAAAGVGSILVPFPHAVDDHQTQNAQYLVAGRAALCQQQTEFNAQWLADYLQALTRAACLAKAKNARALALADAADKVAAAALASVTD
ncbi:MAG: undecaprenyldiphospho-muramoylpentapeptide beta-N-acetylglucosaminyltransferase [Neisseriaceae bacterium]|nr:undecaprenyldiphospho-muramoylpentapeptide beta-N-acetylglucosaminyltransferase [Neisseriaceae bacterium]